MSAPEELPKQIGKYAITGIAGEGNMGTVYAGYDPFTDTQVAIKVCPAAAESGFKIARKLFFNEARTAGSLEHENILSVLDGGEQDGVPYIVMEYVTSGDTLRSYITPDTLLPLARVVEIIYQCARALDYAHRRGVIHRDIKPSNIMLTDAGVVKIGDFGIAQLASSDETQVMGLLGSPRYMSPEQVMEEELTHQCDIFSLGVVAYELVTGAAPFAAKNIAQLVRKIVQDEPTPIEQLRPGVPRELADIIAKALAKNTSERYSFAQEMATDLVSLFGRLDHSSGVQNEEQRYAQVRELAFFNDFSDDELREVLQVSTWQSARAGSTLIAEQTPASAFYMMVNGEGSVQVNNIEIGTLYKGECFGEMAVLSNTERAASVIALEQCTVLCVDSALIENASNGCQLRFNKMFLTTLIARLSRSNERLSQALGAG